MRTTADELAELGISALAAVLEHELGPGSVTIPTDPDAGCDLLLSGPAGVVAVDVEAAAVVDVARARQLVMADGRRPGHQDRVRVVVADLIPEAAQAALRDAGWGYLDRRGRIWFRAKGLVLRDNDLDPLPRSPDRAAGSPITGTVGLGVVVTLLMHPDETIGTRELARRLDCSPSAAHAAVVRLREHALIDQGGHPLVPDLFWIAADSWKPERRYVAGLPTAEALTEETAARYVVSGDAAAVALGAPLVVGGKPRPNVYIATAGEVRRVARALGDADPAAAAAVLSVAPFPAVTEEQADARAGDVPWRLAHPVIVALDLAQDRARGREVLADWNPKDATRVW